jgi:hypothetical protein
VTVVIVFERTMLVKKSIEYGAFESYRALVDTLVVVIRTKNIHALISMVQ